MDQRVLRKSRFYFSGLYSESPNLQLAIGSTEQFDLAVRQVSG
jgi:hypothetical protein